MEMARRESCVILRLEHGEDILRSIEEAAKTESGTMFVTMGLGMISEFELGYFDHGVYVTKEFIEPYELLSMQGSVATSGNPRIHIHVAVADKGHSARGGHLTRGRVWMSNEIVMLRVGDLRSSRTLDPAKNVGVLHIQ